MNIKVIFTGGTISSQATISGFDVIENSLIKHELIQGFFQSDNHTDVNFTMSFPLNILSENMTISHWNLLLKELASTDFSQLDGIIITHGTDTLAFTSAMLSFMLAGIKIPVVLVSSNYILTHEKSNGQDNFNKAVYFIKNSRASGVYCIYRDFSGVSRFYLGSRIKQCENLTDNFFSLRGIDFGIMQSEDFIHNINSLNPTIKQINSKQSEMLLNSIERLHPCVLMITPYTGLDYRCITPTDEIKAVLHLLFHSGTACTCGDENSILEFIKRCNERDIAFFIAPTLENNENEYSSSVKIHESECYSLSAISAEAAYAKLIIAFSTDEIQLRERIIAEDVFFEKSVDATF